MKRGRTFSPKPWWGLLGLTGFLGLLPPGADGRRPYFFFIFFGFFSWFFWGLLMREQQDERMVENQKRANSFMTTCFALLAFFMLFALDKGVGGQNVLLFGSLGYAACFTLSPALIFYLDRFGN